MSRACILCADWTETCVQGVVTLCCAKCPERRYAIKANNGIAQVWHSFKTCKEELSARCVGKCIKQDGPDHPGGDGYLPARLMLKNLFSLSLCTRYHIQHNVKQSMFHVEVVVAVWVCACVRTDYDAAITLKRLDWICLRSSKLCLASARTT